MARYRVDWTGVLVALCAVAFATATGLIAYWALKGLSYP